MLGTFVIAGGYRIPARRTFCLATILTGIWTTFPFLTSIIPSEATALLLTRFIYVAAGFVPAAWLHFMTTVVSPDRTPFRTAMLAFSYLVGLLFIPLSFSRDFITGLTKFAPHFSVVPGHLYPIFVRGIR